MVQVQNPLLKFLKTSKRKFTFDLDEGFGNFLNCTRRKFKG